MGLVGVQVIFIINFFYSMFFGPKAGRNPWHANGLEWTAPSPPGHGNFDFQPHVYRGPYEYGSPEIDRRLLSADPAAARGPAADRPTRRPLTNSLTDLSFDRTPRLRFRA